MIQESMKMTNNMALVGKHLAKKMKPACAYCTRISKETILTEEGRTPVCKYHFIDLTDG